MQTPLSRFFLSVSLTLGSVLCTFSAPVSKSQDVPSSYPATRYDEMTKKSPFALVSANGSATPEPVSTISDLWELVGAMKFANSDSVTLLNKQSKSRVVLTSHSMKEGLTLVSVHIDPDIKKTVAKIKKDEETADLHFASNILSSRPAQTTNTPVSGSSTSLAPAVSGVISTNSGVPARRRILPRPAIPTP